MSNYTYEMTLLGFVKDYLDNTQQIAVYNYRDVNTVLYEGKARNLEHSCDESILSSRIKAVNAFSDYAGILIIDVVLTR